MRTSSDKACDTCFVTAWRVDDRHCPHEEVVEQFVEAISLWMDVANADKVCAKETEAEKVDRVAL